MESHTFAAYCPDDLCYNLAMIKDLIGIILENRSGEVDYTVPVWGEGGLFWVKDTGERHSPCILNDMNDAVEERYSAIRNRDAPMGFVIEKLHRRR